MGWIEDAFNRAEGKKQREKLHYTVTDCYAQLREGGYDHEEAKAVILGSMEVSAPRMMRLTRLWLDREVEE